MAKLTKILIIAANPWDTKRLGLDEEYREIEAIWKSSQHREQFILKYTPATRESDLRQALLDFAPNIVHFSGHGELEGLFFQDNEGNSHQISTQALANLFALFSDKIRCVVLNACYSEPQAYSIAEKIDYVVGMNKNIGDTTAVKYATGFYQALFNGKAFEFAHKFALSTLDLVNIAETDTPVFITKQQLKEKLVKNYLSDYEYDVLVHVADSEKTWAESLVQQLQKHLTQKIPQGLNIGLQTNDQVEMSQAATYLLLLSPAYQLNSSDVLMQGIKRRSVFLAEYEPVKRPELLSGLLSYCFWQPDPKQSFRSLTATDPNYSLHVENLASDIKKRLQALFQQQQQQLKASYKQTTSTTTSHGAINNSVVFVNVATEDRPLAQQVKQTLDKQGIASTLPIDQSSNPLSADIRRDIEINLLNCDAVLVIYGHSSPLWVKEQLLMCHRWQRKREEPLKIIAVHNEQCGTNSAMPESVSVPNLQVFYCPPENIDGYLVKFMEALA